MSLSLSITTPALLLVLYNIFFIFLHIFGRHLEMQSKPRQLFGSPCYWIWHDLLPIRSNYKWCMFASFWLFKRCSLQGPESFTIGSFSWNVATLRLQWPHRAVSLTFRVSPCRLHTRWTSCLSRMRTVKTFPVRLVYSFSHCRICFIYRISFGTLPGLCLFFKFLYIFLIHWQTLAILKLFFIFSIKIKTLNVTIFKRVQV